LVGKIQPVDVVILAETGTTIIGLACWRQIGLQMRNWQVLIPTSAGIVDKSTKKTTITIYDKGVRQSADNTLDKRVWSEDNVCKL